MEKDLTLTYDEATALLEMCLFTYLNKETAAADSALRKLGELCRQYTGDDEHVDRIPVSEEFACACG